MRVLAQMLKGRMVKMANNMQEDRLITREGYDKLVAELEELKADKRKEIAAQLGEAIAQGDLSENADYDAAKNAQAENEERIYKLENMIKSVRIIEESEIEADRINLGQTVVVENIETKTRDTYKIVGSNEADPLNGLMSNESPVGRKLMGSKLDDVVEVEIPDGIIRLKVLEISRS